MTTRAELAQSIYTGLLAFIDQKLVGKEELVAQSAFGSYLSQMRTLNLQTAAALAALGYMKWEYLSTKIVAPMAKIGVVLDAEEELYVKSALDGLTELFCN